MWAAPTNKEVCHVQKHSYQESCVFSFRITRWGDSFTHTTLMWQNTLPSAQLLPGARAPVIILPHRSKAIMQGLCLFIPWYLKWLVVGKCFPSLRKKRLRGWRYLRSNCSCSTLLKINFPIQTQSWFQTATYWKTVTVIRSKEKGLTPAPLAG